MSWLTVKSNSVQAKAVGAAFAVAMERAVASAAFEIEREVKILAPVDTGALKASVYTSTYGKDNRSSALAEARGKYPGPGVKGTTHNRAMPEAGMPEKPRNRLEAIVSVGVEYGRPVNRRNGYWTKALWRNRRRLKAIIAKAAG